MALKIDDDANAFSDINVTPLVDVMLVLLVIFMVTAPMMQQGVQVNLPKAETKALPSQEETATAAPCPRSTSPRWWTSCWCSW